MTDAVAGTPDGLRAARLLAADVARARVASIARGVRGVRGARVSALVAAFVVCVAAGAARAEEPVAVLAVDVEGRPAEAQLAADRVRASLAARGVPVVDAIGASTRLTAHAPRPPLDDAAVAARVAAADSAFKAFEAERSIQILEGVTADLAAAPHATDAQRAELLELRLTIAARLVGLAGAAETGRAETQQGKRAIAHLVDALRADPELSLPPARFAPKMRRVLDEARTSVAAAGRGGLVVTSTPAGAVVSVFGRPLGKTPLSLVDALPRGPCRVDVALDDVAGVPVTVQIGAAPAVVDVDLAFDAGLWPDGPGLRTPAGMVVGAGTVRRLAQAVGAERLALVGTSGARTWVVVVEPGVGLRDAVVAGDPSLLAAFVAGDLGAGVEAGGRPARVLPVERTGTVTSTSAADSPPGASVEDDGFPWWTVGVAAAGIGVVALVAGGAAIAWALTPPTEGIFDVVVAE